MNDDLKLTELSKKIKDVDMHPIKIREELKKFIEEYEPDYKVVFHPFDAPVTIDEAMKRLLRDSEEQLKVIKQHVFKCDCDCCREIQKQFPPMAVIG